LLDDLRRLGFIEGQNLLVDGHGYGLRVENSIRWGWRIVLRKFCEKFLGMGL
jgi:hypothetical protein